MVWDSDKISPWGPVEPESTGGGDLSLFEAFHGAATTAPATTGANGLQQLYSRIPTYFTQYLNPDVQLTVETSLGWPLNMQIYGVDMEATLGNNTINIKVPDSSHWIITHMFVTAVGETGAGKSVQTTYIMSSVASGEDIVLHRYELTNNDRVAIIGTYNAEQHGSFQDSCFGIRPLYISYPNGLQIRLLSLDGGGQITLRALYLQLPASQPFGALIGSL